MLRVWVDNRYVGLLDRYGTRGSTFVYTAAAAASDAVSLTMPKRTASWNTNFRLAPIFDMNLPEGALRQLLMTRFAKATGSFDDFDLLSLVGRTQIGHLRYSGIDEDIGEDVPLFSVNSIIKANRGGDLMSYLIDRYAIHSGLSGVQPKVMIRDENEERRSPSVKSASHIVKFWDSNEYPELAANEFFCLSTAQKLGLVVPAFELSDDGRALVIRRFDIAEDATYLGFEDFCVLNGVGTDKKYEGGYETRLFKRLKENIFGIEQREDLVSLFNLFVLNCAIRNGDAHLKNFGVVYRDTESPVRLAPVYDLVTTRAYLAGDRMALTLEGSTDWPDPKKLQKLGQVRTDLGQKAITEIFESVADAMAEVRPNAVRYFRDRDRDVGERMMAAWEDGVRQSLGQTRDFTAGFEIEEEPEATSFKP